MASGEIVAFAAPSGAGKTTLLRTFVRLAEPQAGQIRLAGASIDAIPGPDLRRRVALVAQRPVLLGQTVEDDLRLGAARPLTPREAVDALEEVGWARRLQSVHRRSSRAERRRASPSPARSS